MPTNWWMFFVSAAIPLLVGFFWYGNMGFGKKWMSVNGFSEEDLQGANMALIFGLSYFFCVMISFVYSGMVIHQTSIFQVMMPEIQDSNSEVFAYAQDFFAKYGDRHRTFSHGAVHGVLLAIFFVFPLISINALFERRGWTYIFIHFGYWLVCLVLMGGLLCTTLTFSPLV